MIVTYRETFCLEVLVHIDTDSVIVFHVLIGLKAPENYEGGKKNQRN